MRLTDRDVKIISHIEKSGGATIEQVRDLFFQDASYTRASVRLKQLTNNNFLKAKQQPTIGKIVYYKDKMPSYHMLVINEILIALMGKYKAFQRNYNIGKSQVDLVVVLNNKKYLLFEIEIFNKVSKEKLTNLEKELQGINADIWIVSQWQNDTRKAGAYKGKVKIEEVKKLGYYY